MQSLCRSISWPFGSNKNQEISENDEVSTFEDDSHRCLLLCTGREFYFTVTTRYSEPPGDREKVFTISRSSLIRERNPWKSMAEGHEK